MYYNNEWVWDNICVIDSHDMNIDDCQGEHCFLVVHHVKNQHTIDIVSDKLASASFNYFNLFGEQSNLWAKSILKKTEGKDSVIVEASKVDMSRTSYNLAMLATLKPKSINFLISDDEFFTEYIVEDVEDIFAGKSRFTQHDWQMFRFGFEFKYHNKDAIVSISDDVLIGFFGEEKKFNTVNKGFREKLFDGSSLYEIWDEISNPL